jgi:hypothetical protein
MVRKRHIYIKLDYILKPFYVESVSGGGGKNRKPRLNSQSDNNTINDELYARLLQGKYMFLYFIMTYIY